MAQRKHSSIQNLAEAKQMRTEARLEKKAAKRLLNGHPEDDAGEEGSHPRGVGGDGSGGFLPSTSAGEGERVSSGSVGQRPLTALQRQVRSRLQSEYSGAAGSGRRNTTPPASCVTIEETSGSKGMEVNVGSVTNVEEF